MQQFGTHVQTKHDLSTNIWAFFASRIIVSCNMAVGYRNQGRRNHGGPAPWKISRGGLPGKQQANDE